MSNETFDNCDSVENWFVTSSKLAPNVGDNILELDTVDKVEGAASLKMVWASNGSNWGGVFYKKAKSFGIGSKWDFSSKPVLKIRFKSSQPLPDNMKFGLVTGRQDDIYAWIGHTYSLLDKVTVLDEWVEVEIDLRLPMSSEGIPDLRFAKQIEFLCWNMTISDPATFRVDFIEKMEGAVIPLQATIKPETAYLTINKTATFNVTVIGGVQPLIYEWRVNDALTSETSNTFTFTASQSGEYAITCLVTDAENSCISVNAIVEVVEPPSPPEPIPPSVDVLKSEIRAVFLWTPWERSPDWNLIAQTCFDYGINTIIIETYTVHFWENNTVKDMPALRSAIKAFHNKGLSVHVLMCLGLTPAEGMCAMRGVDLQEVNWLCFTKQASRRMLKAVTESLAKNYNIDGFMFDYTRWEWGGADMCFCDECKVKFIADTGLTDAKFPNDVLEGARYYWEFIEWRMKPINEAVRDIRGWMRAVKSTLSFSGCILTAFNGEGNWFPMRIGQHTAEWIDQGYLNFVAPNLFTADPTANGNNLEDSLDFYTGGSEGKIATIPFITHLEGAVGEPIPIETFVQTVREMKQRGADGWILFAYGGAGLESLGGRLVDIKPYLNALHNEGLMPPVWAIQDLAADLNSEQTQATVSWKTTKPVKSRIEYADKPLFVATTRYDDFGRPFHYKDIDYKNGIIQENVTMKTEHAFTIPVTSTTQFRVQNIDENGVVLTSSPMSIGDLPEPEPPIEGGMSFLLPFFAIFLVLLLGFLMTGKGGE